MKSILMPLLVVFLTVNSYTQVTVSDPPVAGQGKEPGIVEATKKCTLEYSQMPLVKGVRVGLPYGSVKDVYPEIATNEWFQKNYRVDKSGLFMIPAKDVSNVEFKQDLTQLSLDFQNGEVRIYQFVYKSKKWKSLDEMRKDLSGIFGVDSDQWTVNFNETIRMDCVDFFVSGSHMTSSGKTMNSLAVHRK